MCGEVMLAFVWYVIFNSLVGTPVMVRVFRKNFLFGFVVLCLLLVNGVAESQDEASALADELADIFRWQALAEPQELFRSSGFWRDLCPAFKGVDGRARCEAKYQDMLMREQSLADWLTSSGVKAEINDRGLWVFYLPHDPEHERLEHDERLAAGLEALSQVLTSYVPPEGAGCLKKYPCALILSFEQPGLRLLSVDLLPLGGEVAQ